MANAYFPETNAILKYWNTLRESSLAPLRSAVRLEHLPKMAPRMFILEKAQEGWRFRLAGTDLYRLFGREITGVLFADYLAHNNLRVEKFVPGAVESGVVAVLELESINTPLKATAEMVLMPLRSSAETDETDRIFGYLSYSGKVPFYASQGPLRQFEVTALSFPPRAAVDAEMIHRGKTQSIFSSSKMSEKKITMTPKLRVIEGGLQPA